MKSENSNVIAKIVVGTLDCLLYFFVIEQWAASLSSTSLVIFVNSVSLSMGQALASILHTHTTQQTFTKFLRNTSLLLKMWYVDVLGLSN